MKVYLGGTCNGSTWRDELVSFLVQKDIDYFSSAIEEEDDSAVTRENKEKALCDISVYTISPRLGGVYSVAEVMESAIQNPDRTIFNVIPVDGEYQFSTSQIKSLIQVGKLVVSYGAVFVSGIDATIAALEAMQQRIFTGVKTLRNTDISGTKTNVKDVQVVGDGDLFLLVSKAFSEKEGWMKSTKAMNTPVGCMVQVSTQQRNAGGDYSVSEALSFVPGIKVTGSIENRQFIEI